MLFDIVRFNRSARALLRPVEPVGRARTTLDELLRRGAIGAVERFLVPLGVDLVGRPGHVHPLPGRGLRPVR
jgi:hypothetical protein